MTVPFRLMALALCAGFWAIYLPAAQAELITYDVGITNVGPIFVGDTIDWQIFVTVSESTAGNWGIADASVRLADSTGETLTPGTIGPAFSDYTLPFGGLFNGGTLALEFIGASQFIQNDAVVEGRDPANGGALGPVLLASGSYVVANEGLHTLSTLAALDPSRYFTAQNGATTAIMSQGLNSVSFNVASVPEPSCLAMTGLAACVAETLRRRKRQHSRSSTNVLCRQ